MRYTLDGAQITALESRARVRALALVDAVRHGAEPTLAAIVDAASDLDIAASLALAGGHVARSAELSRAALELGIAAEIAWQLAL